MTLTVNSLVQGCEAYCVITVGLSDTQVQNRQPFDWVKVRGHGLIHQPPLFKLAG